MIVLLKMIIQVKGTVYDIQSINIAANCYLLCKDIVG